MSSRQNFFGRPSFRSITEAPGRLRGALSRLESIPILGEIIEAGTEATGIAEVLALEEAARTATEQIIGVDVDVRAGELDDFISHKRDQRNDGSAYTSNSFLPPTFQTGLGASSHHFNHAAFISYAGANASLAQQS